MCALVCITVCTCSRFGLCILQFRLNGIASASHGHGVGYVRCVRLCTFSLRYLLLPENDVRVIPPPPPHTHTHTHTRTMGNFVFSLTVTILAKDLGASAIPRYRNHLSGAQLCRGKENAPKLRPLSFLGVVYSG